MSQINYKIEQLWTNESLIIKLRKSFSQKCWSNYLQIFKFNFRVFAQILRKINWQSSVIIVFIGDVKNWIILWLFQHMIQKRFVEESIALFFSTIWLLHFFVPFWIPNLNQIFYFNPLPQRGRNDRCWSLASIFLQQKLFQ